MNAGERDVVDLYDSHYGRHADEVYAAVRAETFGEDFGQTSWITAAEADVFAGWLELRPGRRLLEVACGSGGTALRFVRGCGVSAVGIDVNAAGVRAAAESARALGASAEFRVADADATLPFADGSFDALFCNDAVNHLRDRARAIADWARVLRPGGMLVFTDPCVVAGPISKDELAARSSIGHFVFAPPGHDEDCVRAAGLELCHAIDATPAVAETSGRWRAARAARTAELRGIEGDARFDGMQRFLATVHALAAEGRLARRAIAAQKPDPSRAGDRGLPRGAAGA